MKLEQLQWKTYFQQFIHEKEKCDSQTGFIKKKKIEYLLNFEIFDQKHDFIFFVKKKMQI
jgi:hypothetical protein